MKKKNVSLILAIIIFSTIFSSMAIAAGPELSDIGNHWAKDYIDYLTANGAIKGYTDGTFRPESKISRAEFTAILLRAIKNDVGQPKEGKWYSSYITEATNREYILKGEFISVEKNITRGEIARMIVRTMTEEYPGNMADYASQLSDYSKTQEEYKGFVLKAYVKGIITGRPGGVFAYADTATRAEATTMIVRLINKAKRIMLEEPENNDVYLYEANAQKEVKIETSHPELLTHISKGMEMFSSEGYAFAKYYKNYNEVSFYLFKDKAPSDKPIEEREAILSYHIFTEQETGLDYYLPYKIFLYDTTNEIGYKMCKELIMDIYPEAYEKIVKELDSKAKDTSYNKKVWEKVNGREIRVFTFEGSKQISIFFAP